MEETHQNQPQSTDEHGAWFFSDWTWTSWQVILLISNAVLGLIAFEYVWYATRRYRKHDDLHAMFPAFRRTDVKNWSKWRFYFGAMTLLIPRLILSIFSAFIIVLQINICMIGHDRTKPIQNGCRKWLLKWVYNIGARTLAFFIFTAFYSYEMVSDEQVNNYEEWLGTKDEQTAEQNRPEEDTELVNDSRVPKRGKGECSTVVC